MALMLLCLLAANAAVASGSRPKVGVVLSGGGAKGMAHIGALKVIERAGIPIDYIVGTSMGSIIGGLYATGYTPQQLDTLVRGQDWATLLSDRTPRSEQTITEREDAARFILTRSLGERRADGLLQGMVSGRNLDKMFKKLTVGYHRALSFDSLSVSFACVATNAVNGREYVFRRGVLAQAMRASMAIPGVFSPVRIDSMVLVDGGLANNYPADVARAMGADIVIGVMFQNDTTSASDLKTGLQVLNNIVNLATRKKLQDNQALSDLVIHVDTRPYSASSFTAEAIESLILRGEREAERHYDELLKISHRVGAPTVAHRPGQNPVLAENEAEKEKFLISRVVLDGVSPAEARRIEKQCHLSGNREMTFDEIEAAESQMTDEMAYTSVTYTLTEDGRGGYVLAYRISDRRKLTASFGTRLDNEEIASLLLGARLHLRGRLNHTIGLTGRLGKRSAGELDYNLHISRRRAIDAFYRLEYNDINVYESGRRSYNVVYNRHTAGAFFADDFLRNFRYKIGAHYAYYHYRDFLSDHVPDRTGFRSSHFFTYYARIDYDGQDRSVFATRGQKFSARYGIHTDNLLEYRDHDPFRTLTYKYEIVIPLSTSRLRLIPAVSGRHIFGKEYGIALSNVIGGTHDGHYMEQQLAFPGIYNIQLVRRHNVNATLRLRERLGTKFYVWGTAGAGTLSDEFYSQLRSRWFGGFSVGAGLETLAGPAAVSLGYSTYSHRMGLYIDLGWNF